MSLQRSQYVLICWGALMTLVTGCMTVPQIHTSSTATVAPTIDLVTAKYATPVLSDTLTSLSQDWLSDATCRPPCWKGIVPGKTTADEAVAILKKIPFVAPGTIKMGVSSLSSEGELNWGWRGRNVGLDGRAFFEGNTLSSFHF